MNINNVGLTRVLSESDSEITSLKTKNKILVERYAKLSTLIGQIRQDNALLKQELLDIAAEKAQLDKLVRDIYQVAPKFVEVMQVILTLTDFVQGRNSTAKPRNNVTLSNNNSENISVRPAPCSDGEDADDEEIMENNNDDSTESEVEDEYPNGHLSVIMEESHTNFVLDTSQKEMRISLKRLSMGESFGNDSTTSIEAITNDSIKDADITLKNLDVLDPQDSHRLTHRSSIENRSDFQSVTTELTSQTLTYESNFAEQNKSLLVSPIGPNTPHGITIVDMPTPSLSALGDIETYNSLTETSYNHVHSKSEPETSVQSFDSPRSSRISRPRKRTISSVINGESASSCHSSDEEKENNTVSKRKRKTSTKKISVKPRSTKSKKSSSSMSLEDTVKDVQNRLSNLINDIPSDSSDATRPQRAVKPLNLKETSLRVKLRREF